MLSAAGCSRSRCIGSDTLRALEPFLSGDDAIELVSELAPLSRLPATDEFDEAMKTVQNRLAEGGFVSLRNPPDDGPPPVNAPPGYTFILSDSLRYEIWKPAAASLEVLGPEGFVAADTRDIPAVLAMNSRSTPREGIVTRMINLGNGTYDREYEGVDVSGMIVYGRQPLADIYRVAVLERGALGVVSPSAPSWQGTDDHPALVAMGTVGRWGFGFKVSTETAWKLEKAMEQGGGSVKVRATVDAQYQSGRTLRTLVAEIPGSENSLERVALIAPFSGPAPGAGDVSGAAALVQTATALHQAIQTGKLEQPKRSIVFVWGASIAGTRLWADRHTTVVDELHSATVLQLIGGFAEETGKRILVERTPDPSAIWIRPPDEHTPWGAARPPGWPFTGHYISEFTGEIIGCIIADELNVGRGSNPYEGRADHEFLLEQNIPAQRLWCFPDPLYRSSLDTPDHIDEQLLTTGAMAAAVVAYETAIADIFTAKRILTLIEANARARLETALEQARENLGINEEGEATGGDKYLEEEILNAWKIWYLEAIESVMAHPLAEKAWKLRRPVISAVRSLEREWDAGMLMLGLRPVAHGERLRMDLLWK